jgi:uncharacterized protein with NAD-binding domain and iron-sulfur cluster
MAKRRIAVLGGGAAAMSAVFEITDRVGWDEDFEIDVYQLGWRLGGKGASGRNVSGPPGIRNRIEEHGLHIWFGFYENAFNQIQRCYARADRPASHPIATWRDAFATQDMVVTHQLHRGRWIPWTVRFPTNDAVPGQGDPLPDVGDFISMLAQWLLEGWRNMVEDASPVRASPQADEAAERIHRVGVEAPVLPAEVEDEGLFARPLSTLVDWVRGFRDDIFDNPDWVRGYIVFDLLGAVLRGLVVDRVATRGFDQLDDIEFRDWLHRHGASETTLQSAFMAGTYDTVFGFPGGDPRTEAIGAGTGLRSGMRMLLAYKGHFMWKMTAGMGDVIFAPYYEVLRRRGVRFHFFHRVDALRLSADRRHIETIEMRRQATVAAGEYQPLIDVNGLECWPSEPLYAQLLEGNELRQRTAAGENVNLESYWSSWPGVGDLVLRHGTDFDHVLLGIPVAALPYLCADLIAEKQEWRDMVAHVATNRTMNAQLWFEPSVAELGWNVTAEPILGGFVRPLSVWADLSHLLPKEGWAETPHAPRHLAYMVGPMRDSTAPEPPFFSDPDFPAREAQQVHDETRRLLEEHARDLWPHAYDAKGAFDWNCLADPEGRSGAARLEAQYLRGNIDPNERYTLSLPGSSRYRLRPDQSGFTNLTLAGDWTNTGLNAGCVEAAVMSGMQASRAIAGYPVQVFGERDLDEPGD